MASAPLLDREFLEKLERLTIHWQKSFAGLVGGHNKSRFPGAGQEFLDHRNFHQGDDLRAVNWRAYHAAGKALPEDVPGGAARSGAVAARYAAPPCWRTAA